VECGKEVPLVVVNTAIHQKSNRPPKTLRVRTTKTPYLKVVGIVTCKKLNTKYSENMSIYIDWRQRKDLD